METSRSTGGIAPHPFQGRAWRELAQLALEALAAGVLVSLVLALAIFIAATEAQATEPAPAARAPLPAQVVPAPQPARGDEAALTAAGPV